MTIITDKEQLSIPCEEVSLAEGLRIAALLLKELDDQLAVGIAANQIGETGRVFILDTEDGLHVYINPVVHSQDTVTMTIHKEGCLSFPGEVVETMRSSSITVSDALDKHPRKLYGLTAIAFQHELDHLDGITFHARAKPPILDPH